MLFFPRFLMQQLAMKLRIYDALNNAMTSYTTLNASRLYKTHGPLTHRRLVIEKKTKYPNDRTFTLEHPSFKALKKYTELNKVRIIFKLPTINEESDL